MHSGTTYSSLKSKNNCVSVISYAIITISYKCNNHVGLEMKLRGSVHGMQTLDLLSSKEETLKSTYIH